MKREKMSPGQKIWGYLLVVMIAILCIVGYQPHAKAQVAVETTTATTTTKPKTKFFNTIPKNARGTFSFARGGSYDQDRTKIPGKPSFVFTASKTIIQKKFYVSLALGGSYLYRYTHDSLDIVYGAQTADLGAGINIINKRVPLLAGSSVGLFYGVGMRNDAENLPSRFGITSQFNVNFVNFKDWWDGQSNLLAFFRMSYSSLSFVLDDGARRRSMAMSVEFGLGISFLEKN